MVPILIAYSTTEGQTRKIAEFMAEALQDAGHRVELVDTGSAQAALVQPVYAAAILGGSVHAGHHAGSLAGFIRDHAAWLETVPTAFFSVSLTAARDDEAGRRETARMLDEFLARTGLKPRRSCRIAGALRYSRYGMLKRFLMRQIAGRAGGDTDTSRDFEYTNWKLIRRFVLEFAGEIDSVPRQAA
jgi:menaquinone-dependent protoporphyrinogen oxidase